MASLSGQTLARTGVPYYLPVSQFDPSGFPMVASPLIVNGNPYDAYLSASSNIQLTATSNGTPQASMTMTSNISFAVPGMTCNSLTMTNGLTTVGSTLRIDSLGGPGYLQMVDTPTGSLISNIGTPAGSYLAFNNNGNAYLNGGLVATPTTFYAESAGPSRVITNGNSITFASGPSNTAVAAIARTGTDMGFVCSGNLGIVSSNFVVDPYTLSYTASNQFGLVFNPGYNATTNVLSFLLPGGNTSNNILTDSNSMTVNVAGTASYVLKASLETLSFTGNTIYQARTPSNQLFYNSPNLNWGFNMNALSNRFEGVLGSNGGSFPWMTVSSSGAVDF